MFMKLILFLCFYLSVYYAESYDKQRLRIEGRVYENKQPVRLDETTCSDRESDACHMYQKSLCDALIGLLPESIGREATCTNDTMIVEQDGTLRMGFTLFFKSTSPIMERIDVRCSTFTALYLMAMQKALQAGQKALGEPIKIEPEPRGLDWEGTRVEFSIWGTLRSGDSRISIEQLHSLDATSIISEIQRMRGIHTMLQPIFNSENMTLKDPYMIDVKGNVGIVLVATYDKKYIQALNLDPNCTTFSGLLQYAMRYPVHREGYHLDTDTNVTLNTLLEPRSSEATEAEAEDDDENIIPEEAEVIYPVTLDTVTTTVQSEPEQSTEYSEETSTVENQDTTDSGSRLSGCMALLLAILMVFKL